MISVVTVVNKGLFHSIPWINKEIQQNFWDFNGVEMLNSGFFFLGVMSGVVKDLNNEN